MSDITIPYPEAVNRHTDVICSTDIRHVVTVRNEALQQTERVIRQLAEISAMTESIGGKTARVLTVQSTGAAARVVVSNVLHR